MNQNEFHFARQMFAIVDDDIKLAPTWARTYTHLEWFVSQKIIASIDDPKFEKIVRGYYLPGHHVVAYRGRDFVGFKPEAETLMKHLARLQAMLRIPDETMVYVGVTPSGDAIWPPHKPLGTVTQSLSKWQNICRKAQVLPASDTFEFQIEHHNFEQMPIKARLVREASGVTAIYFEGYGNRTMENGHAAAMYFEIDDKGHPVAYVFDNYNQEEFTKKISFENAREPQLNDDGGCTVAGDTAVLDDKAPDGKAAGSAAPALDTDTETVADKAQDGRWGFG